MNIKHWLIPIILLLVDSSVLAQETEDLIKPCVECHGTNGIASKPEVPHLDGQMAEYINKVLRDYSNEIRKTAVPQHNNLPVASRKAIGEYYSTQKVKREKSLTDPALVAKGNEIYMNRCVDCHPDNGRETDKDAPLMAGQNLNYLVTQSLAFRKGERRFATMMDDAYKGLSEADLTAVAHFFASQDQLGSKAATKKRKR